MDIEKLYQDVWAQVFARVWFETDGILHRATEKADEAAADAAGIWRDRNEREAAARKAGGS